MTGKLLTAIFTIVFCAATLAAQLNPEQQVLAAREEFFNIKTRSMELERVKREASKPTLKDDFTVSFPAIKEDFERIQKLNEEVFELTSAKNPINYAAVLKSVTEINHRSARLKSNLFTAAPNEKQPAKNDQSVDAAQSLKNHLAELDKFVIRFTHNSIFQNINLVNPQDSLKAQDDLEEIIEVSSVIKEKTKKLMKNSSEK